ncbi:P-loop NTPase fold protein [Clostridium novyi]
MYQIKDLLLPFIGQGILISAKFIVENNNNIKNEQCDLYKTRKKQLDILKNIIKEEEYENYAIGINGKWGSGKSVLISSLINDCSKNNTYYIYIQPMISDTRQSLIKKFQDGVAKLMRNHGIYSGRNSSLNKYFKEILQLVYFNNKVTLADFIDITSDDSYYKDLKKELQEDINLLLDKGSKKLLVIIDDFDRVDEDKQREILWFIKEVIDFKGCVTIIALDYENLRDNKVVTPIYLEKFIATQIPLVDVEFNEIIEFHAKHILNEELYENEFAKKILLEISNNINNYHNNIIKRINNYYENEKSQIYKHNTNEDSVNKKMSDLDELINFANKRESCIDNSRRVVHFLKEIKNTIILIDKLYKNRLDGEGLLKSINVSEIIYFFNYIKVFYNDIYQSIIKAKGINEYLSKFNHENTELEKRYFGIILGDIIPDSINIGVFKDEYKELIHINSVNLIKDLFINYHFMKNNIELLTNSEKCLKEIAQRIKILGKYVIKLYKQEKIEFTTILEISAYRNNYKNMVYLKYYLHEVCQLVDEGKINKIHYEDKSRIELILEDLEMNNIYQYKYVLINLLVIATLNKNNNNLLLNDINENNKLFEEMKNYSINNNLIKDIDNIVNLEGLIELLFKKISAYEYQVIDVEVLNKRLQEFIVNCRYIDKLKEVKFNNQYRRFPENINEVKQTLRHFDQQEVIKYKDIYIFQNIIDIIIRGNVKDYECKLNIINIFKKLKLQDNCDEYLLLNIMVNVEKVLKLNENIDK